MLVYGDHEFQGQLQSLRSQLCTRANEAQKTVRDLATLRTLLILCGQVEQGAHDMLPHHLQVAEAERWIAQFHQATAHAADAFYNLAWQQAVALPAPIIESSVALHSLAVVLESLRDAPDLPLVLRVPEGFSLYALYPEQYLIAASHWLADHRSHRSQGAVVVGIRSIGTTLAAVVSSELRAAGWQTDCFTVRPSGHPFNRQVDLGSVKLDPTHLALIVDEGPGISGSSMAATASALVEAGIDRHNIAFFPGHANEPGGAGSEDVKAWWKETVRYVGDAHQIRFDGMTLQESLISILPEAVTRVEDFSGGQWRHHLYSSVNEWPAVCNAFERIKYCYTLQSDKKVLFKFLGLGSITRDLTGIAEVAATLLNERSHQALGAPVIGVINGFVATEWIEGTPAHLDTLSPAFLGTIGEYIGRVAGAPMMPDDARAAIERLSQTLCVNIQEAFGEGVTKYIDRFHHVVAYPLTSYGDGHMQPHEWLIDTDGRVVKVDSIGHDCDHTLIDKQSIVWDIAGVIVEWRLSSESVSQLLAAFQAAGGAKIDAQTLDFYCAAYLAFRLGQCSLAAQVHDPNERARLSQAIKYYRQQLACLLETTPVQSTNNLATNQSIS